MQGTPAKNAKRWWDSEGQRQWNLIGYCCWDFARDAVIKGNGVVAHYIVSNEC